MNSRLVPPKHGSLRIEDEQVISFFDKEFAHLHIITPRKKTYLFSKPPTKDQIIKLNHPLYLTELPISSSTYPATLAYKNEEFIGVQAKLNTEEKVLLRELPDYPQVVEIIFFKPIGKKRDDMPESGQGIQILSKGYALREDLKIESCGETFQKTNEDLFLQDDLMEDIKQHTFGDCFLLASIQAILKSRYGKEFITGMMKQEEDGTTIVRLFDPNTRKPIYIRIENSYYSLNGENQTLHQAFWVHALEKAYTAVAFKAVSHERSSGKKYSYTDASFREIFGEGGSPDLAFLILTGTEARDKRIIGTPDHAWSLDNLCLCTMFSNNTNTLRKDSDFCKTLDKYLIPLKNEKSFLCALIQTLNQYINSSDNLLLELTKKKENCSPEQMNLINFLENFISTSSEDSENLISELIYYLKKFKELYCEYSGLMITNALPSLSFIGQFGDLLTELKTRTVPNLSHEIEEVPTQRVPTLYDEFLKVAMVEKSNLSAEQLTTALSNIMRFMGGHRLSDSFTPLYEYLYAYVGDMIHKHNGGLASAHYSDEAKILFDSIKQCFSPPKKNSTYSYSVSPLVASTKSHFPDEAKGLRPNHAYTIIGTESIGNLKFIKLRNPWGHTGREYNLSKAEAKESLEGDFKVELSDFVKYFEKYTIAKPLEKPELEYLWQTDNASFGVPLPGELLENTYSARFFTGRLSENHYLSRAQSASKNKAQNDQKKHSF